jgi:hypothetical protein
MHGWVVYGAKAVMSWSGAGSSSNLLSFGLP